MLVAFQGPRSFGECEVFREERLPDRVRWEVSLAIATSLPHIRPTVCCLAAPTNPDLKPAAGGSDIACPSQTSWLDRPLISEAKMALKIALIPRWGSIRRKIARAVEGCWYSRWKTVPGRLSRYSNDRSVEPDMSSVHGGFPVSERYLSIMMRFMNNAHEGGRGMETFD